MVDPVVQLGQDVGPARHHRRVQQRASCRAHDVDAREVLPTFRNRRDQVCVDGEAALARARVTERLEGDLAPGLLVYPLRKQQWWVFLMISCRRCAAHAGCFPVRAKDARRATRRRAHVEHVGAVVFAVVRAVGHCVHRAQVKLAAIRASRRGSACHLRLLVDARGDLGAPNAVGQVGHHAWHKINHTKTRARRGSGAWGRTWSRVVT